MFRAFSAHHQEKNALSMRHWYLSLCMGGAWSAGWISIQPPYQCRIDTATFSWWWAHGSPKHVEKRNKYIKQNCAPSWTYLRNTPVFHSSFVHAGQHAAHILSSSQGNRRRMTDRRQPRDHGLWRCEGYCLKWDYFTKRKRKRGVTNKGKNW